MKKKANVVNYNGHADISIDYVVPKGKDPEEVGSAVEKLLEAHLNSIGVCCYVDLSTPEASERQHKNHMKWAKERQKEEKDKLKKKIAKAVSKAVAETKGK